MKKTAIIITFLIVLLGLPFAAKAASENNWAVDVYIPANQTIEDNYVRAGNTFDVRGIIEGDLIVGASSLDITGKVTGDVLAAATNIKISGEVEGNIRVAGGTVNIEGKVGKNVNIFAGTVNLSPDSEILGDVTIWAGSVNMKGLVHGSVYGGAGSVIISGKVTKNIEFRFDGEDKFTSSLLTVTSDAKIGGNLNYYSDNEAEIDEEATITGVVTKHEPTGIGKATRGLLDSIWWIGQIANIFGLLVVGLITVWLFGKKTKEITSRMLKNPGKQMLLGLAILILTPIVGFILIFTVIGFPLGIIILLLYGILLYISTVFFAVFLGEKILLTIQKKKKEISISWSLLVGLLVYIIAVDVILWSGSFLGFLGGIIKFIILLWVFGAIFYPVKQKK